LVESWGFSSPLLRPFLNSVTLEPNERASSGSLRAPNSRMITTAISTHSMGPMLAKKRAAIEEG
jgi:hypothetical protein